MPMLARTRLRRGFTLIELLIVMAIICILIGLLLPAVQYAREAANRTVCGNNLKQMGLASRHYEMDKGTLPVSRLANGGATWAVLIFPYMEQKDLFNLWDLKLAYYEQSDAARGTRLTNYFCPSRRGPGEDPVLSIQGDEWIIAGATIGPNVPGALGDYACNIGTSGADEPHALCFQFTTSGSFKAGPSDATGTKLLQIKDGLSNTLLIGEKHVPKDLFGYGGWDCSMYNGGYYFCSSRSAGIAFPLAQSIRDPGWKFGSYHPAVCQFVFVDGSVHGISPGIDPQTLERLANIADGEILGRYELGP
jgi:prepilin-type N-terminal cleavage/methylation domain-containing protein